MKQLILTLILVTLSTPVCFGEWIKVTEDINDNTFYVDFERIRERDGHVYYWELADYRKPTPSGFISYKMYWQGDCDLFRFKMLAGSFYSRPMGKGDINTSGNEPQKNWEYAPPDSVVEGILETVCDYVKLSEEGRKNFLQAVKELE